MTRLSELLGPGEVLDSAGLARRIAASGRSLIAARQVISRSSDPAIWKLPIRLPGRSRLFALRDSRTSDEFYLTIARKLEIQRPGIARVIRSLLNRGVLLQAEAQRVLASPYRRGASRTPTFESEVGLLVDLELCRREATGTSLERISLSRLAGTAESHDLARSARAKSLVANQLSSMLTRHFRDTTVVGWTSVTLPIDGRPVVEFNNYPFSASAFSHLEPLVRRAKGMKPKPAPVLFEVLGRECDLEDAGGFIHRLKRISNNPNSRLPVLGVIAAVDFSKLAWSTIKRNGLYAINLSRFYGPAALTALSLVERLLQYDLAVDSTSEEDVEALAGTLEALRHHPYVSDLRSLGFEVACGLLLRSDGWEDVQLGLNVPWHDSQRDVDAIGKRRGGQEIIVVECKAEHEDKELDRASVKKFFTETVPAALRDRKEARNCVAELWTTGVVGKDAEFMLQAIQHPPGVTARLVSKAELLARVPPTLSRCGRLIATAGLPS